MQRSIVVLPQPDGPTIETSSPAATSKDTSPRTVSAPYRLCRPCTLRMAIGDSNRGGTGSFAAAGGRAELAEPPVEQAADRRDEAVEDHADDAEQQHDRPHVGEVERRGGLGDD